MLKNLLLSYYYVIILTACASFFTTAAQTKTQLALNDDESWEIVEDPTTEKNIEKAKEESLQTQKEHIQKLQQLEKQAEEQLQKILKQSEKEEIERQKQIEQQIEEEQTQQAIKESLKQPEKATQSAQATKLISKQEPIFFPIACGLKNTNGIHCYMLSVIQGLISLPPFIKEVENSTCEHQDSVHQKFIQYTFKPLMQTTDNTPKNITDSFSIPAAQSFFPTEDKKQQDAHEFLTNLLNDFGQNHSNIKSLFQIPIASQNICSVCKTKFIKIEKDPFNQDATETILSLALPSQPKTLLSIETVLPMYTEEEVLTGDNKYNCRNCGQLQDATKQLFFFKAMPPILCIHLKRFGSDWNREKQTVVTWKNNMPIIPSLSLKIPYSRKADNPEEKQEALYQLAAIILHEGDKLDTGHFTTLAWRGKWLYFNDSVVSDGKKILNELLEKGSYKKTSTLTARPYIVFYKKISK